MKRFKQIFLSLAFLAIATFLAGPNLLGTTQAQVNPNASLHAPVCTPAGNNNLRCHARVVVDQNGRPQTTTLPNGYGPKQFQGAYSLTGQSASGRILAIVDAYDHPNIKSDLDTYSNNFGLPILPMCSGSISASTIPCFQKSDQNGGTNYPNVDASWALEISLDVEVAHAICPDCKILLVEASSNSYSDLLTAVDQAVASGATVVSNSYGSREFSAETSYDSHFNKPGVAFIFSAGDSGYGTSYPAASKYVTSVGGTTLYVNADNSYNSESVWSGTGSGCASFESKPAWQTDKGCLRRTMNDVSADANPSTGAAVYDSVPYAGQTGWFKVGGTSLSAPIIAGAYALKGVPSTTAANSLPYLNNPTTNLHDITSGSDGQCKKTARYLCTATNGYDGPTGLGTPRGTGAF